MKHLLKIGALSLALIASIFLLNNNTTNAGDVTLQITGSSGYCIVGNNVPFGATGFSYNSYSISTGFATASGNNTRLCNDANGQTTGGAGSWVVKVTSSNVANTTTSNTGHTISSGDVQIKADTPTVTAGSCIANTGTANAFSSLSGDVVLFGKSGNTGEVCTVTANNVELKITLTGSQAIGQYSGTLTITVPNL